MKELSLNILDIAKNSVKAKAENILIKLDETDETLTLTIKDDGCGMSEETVKNVINKVTTWFEENKDEIACVILEPIACNMGLVVGKEDFLFQLRELCTNENIVLIFDEVISGFRIAYGGAASYFGITPDMACFGKIIGGGLPVGAYGGKKEIMSMILSRIGR